jgi:hypothetical protein
MPGKMARSDPRPSVRITRGAGSGQHLASVLQWHLDAFLLGRNSANICVGLGVIRGIPVYAHATIPACPVGGTHGIQLKQAGRTDPPPLKWSDLRYVFDIKEDCNGKEAIQA